MDSADGSGGASRWGEDSSAGRQLNYWKGVEVELLEASRPGPGRGGVGRKGGGQWIPESTVVSGGRGGRGPPGQSPVVNQ